jgi:hypothetical protein
MIRRLLARLAALLATTAALAAPAVATLTDYTDLWYTSTEPGHGVYIVQEGNIIFLAMFVYDGATLPRWYYGSNVTPVNGSNTSWSGQLAQNQGTSFASPWNPAQLFPRVVGTVTLDFTSPSQGTMSFTVDNIPVTQQITRFTFGNDSLAGVYAGGLVARGSACAPAAIAFSDRLTVDHAVQGSPRFTVDFFTPAGLPATCTFTGTYSQQGKAGTVSNGTFSCTGAADNAGTFSMSELAVNRNGLSARFTGKDQHCASFDGYFGGVRDVQ